MWEAPGSEAQAAREPEQRESSQFSLGTGHPHTEGDA